MVAEVDNMTNFDAEKWWQSWHYDNSQFSMWGYRVHIFQEICTQYLLCCVLLYVCEFFCFVLFFNGGYCPYPSGQSYDCPSASEGILKKYGWIHHVNLIRDGYKQCANWFHLDSFTFSFHNRNCCVRACTWPLKNIGIITSFKSWKNIAVYLEPTVCESSKPQSISYASKTQNQWCQPYGDPVSNQSHNPSATRLGICNSLDSVGPRRLLIVVSTIGLTGRTGSFPCWAKCLTPSLRMQKKTDYLQDQYDLYLYWELLYK